VKIWAVVATAIPSVVEAMVGILVLVPLAVIGALVICGLAVAVAAAIGAWAWWTLDHATETVLGPARDL
jgi:hypothetical protein